MDILYSDNRILVCVKPAGVLSTDEPGGMPSLLRAWLGDEHACVRTVHRLDRTASGLMVFARSRAAASLLSEQVRGRAFTKEYLAVCEGSPEPACGRMEDLLARDRARNKTVTADAPGKDVRPASLRYRVAAEKDGLALARICLETGRTHQIRAQFSTRGWPLAGDRKYGAQSEGPLALFSCRLGFSHPQTGEPMDFFRLPPREGFWLPFSSELAALGPAF